MVGKVRQKLETMKNKGSWKRSEPERYEKIIQKKSKISDRSRYSYHQILGEVNVSLIPSSQQEAISCPKASQRVSDCAK